MRHLRVHLDSLTKEISRTNEMRSLIIFVAFFLAVRCSSDQKENLLCDPHFPGPGDTYTIPHPESCDRYVVCQKGNAVTYQCEDGLAYQTPLGCRPLHTVNCTARPILQQPRGNGDCPRLYGVFPDSRGCGRFFKCVNGTAVPDKCSAGLMFDEKIIGCRDSTKEEVEQCQQLALLGCNGDPNGDLSSCTWFRCPANDPYPYGEHSRHPYPGNCRYYILCMRGGTIKIQGCPDGTVYFPTSSTCVPESEVPSCKLSKSLTPFISEVH